MGMADPLIEVIVESDPVTEVLSGIAPIVISGSGNLPWEEIAGSQDLQTNKAYRLNSLTFALLSLPGTAVENDRIKVYSRYGLFRITQSQGQTIQVNYDFTTSGVTGSLESQETGAIVELTYLENIWVCTFIQGNFQVN
jgi:hypothetical protein